MNKNESKTYEDRIRDAYPKLSKSFTLLADFILDSYIEAAFMTTTELGHIVNVDATTVVRFSQHLGYTGYPELVRDIRARVKSHLIIQPQTVEESSFARVVKTALHELRTILGQAYMLLDVDEMSRLVEKIGESRRVMILSDVLAQPATYTLVNLLERGGFCVSVAQTSLTDLARTMHAATENDLLLAIEVAGEVPYIARTITEAQSKGIPTAAIVGSASIETTHATDLVLIAQAQPATELQMMLVNAIVYALGQALRWRFPERFSGTEQAIEDLSNRIMQS
ncbi:MAG: MurR/RpiR family transcriptional regulator [Anaerolineales bacterium]